ncbi:hypothetical protein FB45DRAFT_861886 [Roridomyces roridus]|uniref:F-box domain-containing protein n=1 Tax=Roridomyces roridus TaxID=1738132 RepID=A0AAD7FV69_9AGAR|nr:hypothetical protein FB45DRAFT_861886 [Roridomyces roridus]
MDNQMISGFELLVITETTIDHIDAQMPEFLCLREPQENLPISLKSLVAPIRKLPAELYLDIFELVTAANEEDWLRSLLTLCLVCPYWRRLACTTPQLWNRPLNPILHRATPDTYLAMAQTFLERSALLPIPILLSSECPEAAPLVEHIYSLAPRWKSLQFHHGQVSRLRQLPEDALQSLEVLDLSHRSSSSDALPIEALLHAPLLRVVSLDVDDMNAFHMPWSQLTHITIAVWVEDRLGRGPPTQNFFDILAQCKNVVNVDFSGIDAADEHPGPTGPLIEVPRLQTLSVEFRSFAEGYLTSFFARLALPALNNLTISSGSGARWSSPDFTAFQRRSPNIEHLGINSAPELNAAELTLVLAESHNLVSLRLSGCIHKACWSSVLDHFHYASETATPIAPRLRRMLIDLTEWGVGAAGEELMERTILSRWWKDDSTLPRPPPVSRWEKLTVALWPPHLSEQFLRKAEQLRQEGLDLELADFHFYI